MKEINIEDFKKQYLDNNLTQEECAKIFGCSKTTINRFCKKYNIVKGKGHGKNNEPIIQDKDAFIQYYITQNHTQEECAAYFNCSRGAIVAYCKANNITKTQDKINENISKNRKLEINSDQVQSLYVDQNLSQQECGDLLGCSSYTIGRRVKENKIEKEKPYSPTNSETKRQNTCLEKYGVNNPSKLQEVQNKIAATCIERYGVPTYLMTEKCQNAAGHQKFSKPNNSFANFLDLNKIPYEREYKIKNYSYDFLINGTLVEINPTPTHNIKWKPFGDHNPDITKGYHKEKRAKAIENGKRCLMLWDWDNPLAIKNFFISTKEKIYARQCDIKVIDEISSKNFVEKYHFQGYAKAEITYGLFFKDELVSIMSFGKPRYNKNFQWELIRYCSSKQIVGGSSKLFSHFIQDKDPVNIVSYCDLSKFSGATYKKLGFKLLRTSSPSLHWFNVKTKKHFTDNLIRAYGVSRVVNGCSPEQDEIALNAATNDNYTLMLLNGFLPVYDCGQQTWSWTK